MGSHDSIIMNSTDNSPLAAVMRTAMIVNLNTCIETKTFDQAIRVENRVEVDPDVTTRRPGSSGVHNAPAVIADVFLGRTQMLTQAGILKDFVQFVLAAGASIEDTQAIARTN